jgi:hypothetical protein
MLLMQIITVYSEIHMTPISSPYEQKQRFEHASVVGVYKALSISRVNGAKWKGDRRPMNFEVSGRKRS